MLCDHPGLFRECRAAAQGALIETVPIDQLHERLPAAAAQNPNILEEECPVCLEKLHVPTFTTTCDRPHVFCQACILEVLGSQSKSRCPMCRSLISRSDLVSATHVVNVEEEAAGGEGEEDLWQLLDRLCRSEGSKISRLKHMLLNVPAGEKALVFSHFPAFLDKIRLALLASNIEVVEIYSKKMCASTRESALCRFRQGSARVLLLPTNSAGLNITAANHCFLMEPTFADNQEAEEQAIGRAWRMGQTREVRVVRFVTQGTLEQDMHESGAAEDQSTLQTYERLFAAAARA